MEKTHLDVWALGAKLARMDAEIGQLWKLVDRLMVKATGQTAIRRDPRNLELFGPQPEPTNQERSPTEQGGEHPLQSPQRA